MPHQFFLSWEHKKGGGGSGRVGGGTGGCKQRIEVIVKNAKKSRGDRSGVGGVGRGLVGRKVGVRE